MDDTAADGQPGPDRKLDQRHFTRRSALLNAGVLHRRSDVVEGAVAQFRPGCRRLHYDNAIWQNENFPKGLSGRTVARIDPPDGRIPALTDEARRRPQPPQAGSPDRRTDSYQDRTLAERCITWGNDGPPIMPVGYNANLDIFQGPGYVVVRTEMIHSARLIPIDGTRPHVGQNIRQWNGVAATGTAMRSSSRRRISGDRVRFRIRHPPSR
jgi:hypothetical protein